MDDMVVVQDVQGAGRGHGFVTLSEQSATEGFVELDLLAMARRCLRIVGICMRSQQVSASELVDEIPSELEEEIVREKAEDYGYVESG